MNTKGPEKLSNSLIETLSLTSGNERNNTGNDMINKIKLRSRAPKLTNCTTCA